MSLTYRQREYLERCEDRKSYNYLVCFLCTSKRHPTHLRYDRHNMYTNIRRIYNHCILSLIRIALRGTGQSGSY